MHEIEKYYEIFNLTPEASFLQVKKTYRSLIKKWHPDRYQQYPEVAEEATEKLKEINEAFEAIKNFEGTEEQKKLREILKNKLSYKDYMDIAGSYEVSAEKAQQTHNTSYYSATDWVEKDPKKERLIVIIAGIVVLLFILLNILINLYDASRYISSSHPSFSLGATSKQVERIQGQPDIRTREKWVYKNSAVYFKDNIVVGYSNNNNELYVKINPSGKLKKEIPGNYYIIGSSKNDVIRIQGTPTSINPVKDEWNYGKSILTFNTNHLIGYRNYSGELKVKPLIDDGNPSTATTIEKGVSKEDVLKIQGSPDTVEGNYWKYGPSWINFVDNQVADYYSGNNVLNAKP